MRPRARRAVEERGDFWVYVQCDDGRARLEKLLAGGAANAASGTGDEGNLAAKRWGTCLLAKFGLLELPVLDVEDVSWGKGFPAAEGFGKLHDFCGMGRDVGDDRSFAAVCTEGDEPGTWPDGPARGRVEAGQAVLIVLVEVGAVGAGVVGDVLLGVASQDNGRALGPNGMVGSDGAAGANRCDVGTISVGSQGRAVVQLGEDWDAAEA